MDDYARLKRVVSRALTRLGLLRQPEEPGAAQSRRRKIERERMIAVPAGELEAAEVTCPVCSSRVTLSSYTCPECGFPFVCDITPYADVRQVAIRRSWRHILGVAAVLLWFAGSVFVFQRNEDYYGYTEKVVPTITPARDSGIAITGPAAFQLRTQLALGLLDLRASDFYLRMRQEVREIGYLAPNYMTTEAGRRLNLEGIGAVSTPSEHLVQVLTITAFPNGVDQLYDYDVFTYAGVLVHELRHIELYVTGQSPGGWQEEVLCEEAAYTALKKMDAPDGILLRYELYFKNPLAGRYQRWYDWYKQQE